ncbi:MAG: M28 family metallopeptidase [Pseudomonadota bacterium]|nr:M28 family metallopeptidase [Pseudomonadota bacterium]
MKKIYLSLLVLIFLGCEEKSTYDNSSINKINEGNLHRHIQILASDEYGGRAPGSPGGEKTKQYMSQSFKDLSIEALDKNYLIEVPLVEMTVTKESYLSLIENNKERRLKQGSETVYWTKRVSEKVSVKNSDLVFVGYGIVAPEYQWNDYKGIDMKGKTAVILINDPGFATQDSNLFKGNAMTYYGRWTYKYEEAARQGAEAVLIIHETKPAAYPWQVVETSWQGKQIDLKRDDMGQNKVNVEAWITYPIAKEIFTNAKLDLVELKQQALQKDFQPVAIPGVKLKASLVNQINFSISHNVAGIKKGTTHPEEFILMMAHWDHLGTKEGLSGDNIYNGAVDNATGIAGILELARTLSASENQRSLLFLAVTAEESGLLGSAYFAEYPPIELSNIVAGYNFDGVLPVGKTKDVIVVGHGASELEDILQRELEKVGKYIVPDPMPEKGFFYRSDHISFAKKGVPVLYADGGFDKLDGGKKAGRIFAEEYTAKHYHQPSDEYDPNWDLGGFVDQLTITANMVKYLANSDRWPKWYEGNEFKEIREKSLEKAINN